MGQPNEMAADPGKGELQELESRTRTDLAQSRRPHEAAARHFLTQLRRLMNDHTSAPPKKVFSELGLGKTQGYEWMGARAKRLNKSWDKFAPAVSYLVDLAMSESPDFATASEKRPQRRTQLIEEWRLFHQNCVDGVIAPSPLPDRKLAVDRCRSRVLSSTALLMTLRDLYPGYPLVNLWGRDMPICVFPAGTMEMREIESPLGQLRAGLLPDDFEYSDDFDPAGRDAFERSMRRWDKSTDEQRQFYFSGPTYALDQIRFTEAGSPKLDCKLGRYFTAMATSEALDGELMLELAKADLHPIDIRSLVQRSWLRNHANNDEVLNGAHRDGAVSHATVIMLATSDGGYDVVLTTRSTAVETHAEFSHVTPSGIFSPYSEHPRSPRREFSVRRNFYREFLEELYDRKEDQREKSTEPSDPATEDEITRLSAMFADQTAHLRYTGVSVNLLTLRPEICLLLKIDDPDWLRRETATRHPNGRSLRLNWESERDPAKIRRLDRAQPSHMIWPLTRDLTPFGGRTLSSTFLVPNAAAALSLALRTMFEPSAW